MEYLVRIAADLPETLIGPEREQLLARERARGTELRAAGTIARIWRLPGTTSNIGIWVAADADELHDALASLPIFPWASIEITELATHPLER